MLQSSKTLQSRATVKAERYKREETQAVEKKLLQTEHILIVKISAKGTCVLLYVIANVAISPRRISHRRAKCDVCSEYIMMTRKLTQAGTRMLLVVKVQIMLLSPPNSSKKLQKTEPVGKTRNALAIPRDTTIYAVQLGIDFWRRNLDGHHRWLQPSFATNLEVRCCASTRP
jgi:hypothetical protein